MPIRYLIRSPKILSTPKRIADALSIRTRCKMETIRINDFRMFYSRNHNYGDLPSTPYQLFTSHKAAQRKTLEAEGLPTIQCAFTREDAETLSSTSYVVRPLYHSGGRGWRVTNNNSDFQVGQQYIQPLHQKKREFRVLFVLGKLTAILRKTVPTELQSDVPWNHSQGSSFIRVTRERNNYLLNTGIIEQLENSNIIKDTDIIAVDIIQTIDGRTLICEVNSSPGISIPQVLEDVVSTIRNHPRFQ